MQPRFKRVYLPRFKFALLLLGGFLVLLMAIKGALWWQALTRETGLTPGTITQLIFDSGANLKPIDNRTNVLLLGIAGGTHAGADLTDTIMVLSFNHLEKSLAMISVPRDLWSATLKDKVNSAYHYGEEKSREAGKKGGGLVLAKAIVSDMVGLPIHYAFLIDFSGFTKVIDLVGGVNITVPQAFIDPNFPIPGKEEDLCEGDLQYRCRYETLHFDAGEQLMDGALALKYVRSRQAEGDEGSDFARSRRQQAVLVALKDKLSSLAVFLNPGKMRTLLAAFGAATQTDMNMGELLTVGKLFARTPEPGVKRISLDSELYTPPFLWYGRYVLLPKEDFPAIHRFVGEQLR